MPVNLNEASTPAEILACYEQIYPGIRTEWIDGTVAIKALPGWVHGNIGSQINGVLRPLFHGKQSSDGKGGWWIASEISIEYPHSNRILQADLAGWRRDNHPKPPSGSPVTRVPDWVCEICHTTRQKDRGLVLETLALAGVPYYWFVDAEERFLEVWELQSNQEWKIIKTLTENDGEKRIEPFTTVALSTQKLLEKDW